MRQLLTIFFILSLTVPFISVFSWLSVEKKVLKKEVKHQIMEITSNDELISFTFHKADTAKKLHWEHENEFEYKGEMYDVVRREYSNDQVTYYLWWDHKETSLNKKLNTLTASIFDQSPTKEKSSQQLSFFLNHLFVEDFTPSIITLFECELKHGFHYRSGQLDRAIEVSSPPPRYLRIA